MLDHHDREMLVALAEGLAHRAETRPKRSMSREHFRQAAAAIYDALKAIREEDHDHPDHPPA